MVWHKKIERKAIRLFGGKPKRCEHCDGFLGKRPVDVKAVRKDDRFRIGKLAHAYMVRNNGVYLFVNAAGFVKRMRARTVSRLLRGKSWFKDRDYPHCFVAVSDVFGGAK